MIAVTLNEANFEYDIHSLIKAFYPKEDVCVTVGAKALEEDKTEVIEEKEEKELLDKVFYFGDIKEKAKSVAREVIAVDYENRNAEKIVEELKKYIED